MMNRRTFLSSSLMAAGAMSVQSAAAAGDLTGKWLSGKKSQFTMWQLPSFRNDIGNSYIFRTSTGKVIVMDGGQRREELTLRGFIGALGGEVEAWFVSHPHGDHMGALCEILKNPLDLRIRHIYHSRITEPVIKAEPEVCEKDCREFYNLLDNCQLAQVTDIQEAGGEYDFDGMYLKILSVANDFTTNAYNNSSMIMRVWDRRKSILFLGDAGVECGRKALEGPYRQYLDSEYVQMAHHGQNGCDEHFYRSIKFRACLWSTPLWVWNNDQGKGFNTGILRTFDTRVWMDRLLIKEHHVSCVEGIFRLD